MANYINSDGVIFLSLSCSCSKFLKIGDFQEIPFAFHMHNDKRYIRRTFPFYEGLANKNGLQFKIIMNEDRLGALEWGIGDYWVVVTKIKDTALGPIAGGTESFRLLRDSL